MFLKRKRSDSEISTTSSLLSSPLSTSLVSVDAFQSSQQIQTPSLFSSRTRKRHRDNRPSESIVHEHTLSLLFSAQQNSRPEIQLSPEFEQQQEPIASLPSNQELDPHQSTLHSFFNIHPARQSSPSSLSSNASDSSSSTPLQNTNMSSFFPATHCEDCDTPLSQLGDSNAMDVDMMDIDGANGANYACEGCGKSVCHSCAMSNFGEQRKCRACAGMGQKQWVGGIGWI